MNNKKKIMIACIAILAMTVAGYFIKQYNASNKPVSSTRVNQEIDKKDVKKERKKEETKKKEEEKKKEETKKKEKKKKEEESRTDKKEKSTYSNTINKDSEGSSNNGIKKTVNIRVEGYDRTFVPRTQITVEAFNLNPYLGPATGSSATASKGWGIDKFKEPTNAHALVRVLEKYGFQKGSGYDFQDYGWGLYMAMIGGNREFDYRSTSGWMYRVNNVLPNVGCQGTALNNEDEILWYFGAYGFDTLATELKVNTTSVSVGQSITISLNGIKNDVNTWKEYREPVKGATIYSNKSPLNIDGNNILTNESGKATIKFDKPGTYILSAERINNKNLKDIVRPQPVIITVK